MHAINSLEHIFFVLFRLPLKFGLVSEVEFAKEGRMDNSRGWMRDVCCEPIELRERHGLARTRSSIICKTNHVLEGGLSDSKYNIHCHQSPSIF